jgi:hypothetical protein
MSQVHLVIVCHDDASMRKAWAVRTLHFPGAHVVIIPDPLSRYFENQVWSHLEATRQAWEHCDYVGVVTYNIERKVWDMAGLKRDLAHQVRLKEADVLTMMNIDYVDCRSQRATAIDAARHHHGEGFLKVWRATLPAALRAHSPSAPSGAVLEAAEAAMPSFFCNYWLARPEWMTRYLSVAAAAMHAMDSDPRVSELAGADSGYRGSLPVERLVAMTGRPFYTMHTFVMERLPSLFFTLHGAKIRRLGRNMLFALSQPRRKAAADGSGHTIVL